MSDRIRQYQDALRRLQQAEHVGDTLAREAATLGSHLSSWRTTNVAGANVPDEWIFSGVPLINFSKWPTMKQIQDAVTEYHAALLEAQNVWNNMDPDDQTGLAAPPKR